MLLLSLLLASHTKAERRQKREGGKENTKDWELPACPGERVMWGNKGSKREGPGGCGGLGRNLRGRKPEQELQERDWEWWRGWENLTQGSLFYSSSDLFFYFGGGVKFDMGGCGGFGELIEFRLFPQTNVRLLSLIPRLGFQQRKQNLSLAESLVIYQFPQFSLTI